MPPSDAQNIGAKPEKEDGQGNQVPIDKIHRFEKIPGEASQFLCIVKKGEDRQEQNDEDGQKPALPFLLLQTSDL